MTDVLDGVTDVLDDATDVLATRTDVLAARTDVLACIKRASGTAKNAVFTLKPVFLSKSGQIGTVSGAEVQRQGAKRPRRKVKPNAPASRCPFRILKGFAHPAQGCATRATLGENQNHPHQP